MSNRRRNTLLSVMLIAFVLISTIIISQADRSEENLDTRSEASQEQDGEPNSSPKKKYGVLIMNNKPFDGTYSDEKSRKYLDIVDANYDSVMTQYGRLFAVHRDGRDNYNWDLTDPIINWANENDKEVLWHNVIIHSKHVDDPSYSALHWYQDLPSDAERLVAMEEHVRTIVKHYKGKVHMYHLVNHFLFIDGDGNYMNTGKDIEEFMVLAFTWANEEDDDALYIANAPTGGMTVPATKDLIIERVNRVNSKLPEGSKIDVIGIMGHFGRCTGEIPSLERIDQYLTEINTETGLPIQISEFDISYDSKEECEDPAVTDPYEPFTTKDGDSYDSWFDYQAKAYKDLYDLFGSHDAVAHVFQWGYYDGDHRRAYAGTFYGPDEGEKANDLDPKPAYLALKEQLCTPLCTDRECGYDGCGGTCGECKDGGTCGSDYKCTAQCTPDCSNKECGDDGCGGSCGDCEDGKKCDTQNKCVEGKKEDLNGDGKIDMLDISKLLAKWGESVDEGTVEDINGDLKIDMLDISSVLAVWD
jgi:GH35 family endo-1,4-beta-xylanase